jgi:hypothetical protein
VKGIDFPKALRLRARIADALGEQEQARLLRGFAETIAKDPGAVVRVRQRIAEQAALVDEVEVTPIVQVMRDALCDLESGKVQERAKPLPLKARPPEPAPRAEKSAAPVADTLRVELADLRNTFAQIGARLEALEAREAPEPIKLTDTIVERLRTQRVPDGRTWLHVVETIADAYGLQVEHLTSRSRKAIIAQARAHVWWWLRQRAGRIYSFPHIGAVWGYDHTTVMYGVQAHAARIAAAPPSTPSGSRLRDDDAAREVAAS